MGTSTSTKGANGNSPLVPSWAENGDNWISTPDNNSDIEDGEVSNNNQVQGDAPIALPIQPSDQRFFPAKKALTDLAKGVSGASLNKVLGGYSRAIGGGTGGLRRLASTITASGNLISLLSGNSIWSEQTGERLSLSDLQGLTGYQAIDKISDFLSPNNPDKDSVRISIFIALDEVLASKNVTNLEQITFTKDILENITAKILTESIYQQILMDMGESWLYVDSNQKAMRMENDLYDLVKVKTEKITNILFEHQNLESINEIRKLQGSIIKEVIDSWDEYFEGGNK